MFSHINIEFKSFVFVVLYFGGKLTFIFLKYSMYSLFWIFVYKVCELSNSCAMKFMLSIDDDGFVQWIENYCYDGTLKIIVLSQPEQIWWNTLYKELRKNNIRRDIKVF